MTTVPTGFAAATPIETPAYSHLKITGPEQGTQIETVFAKAVARKVIAVGHTTINSEGYRVQVDETHAGPGDYLVVGTNSNDEIVSVELYRDEDSSYTALPTFSGKFK